MRVAVLGIGFVGRPIVERLRISWYEVVAYNRTATKCEPLSSQGVTVVSTPPTALAGVDCVFLMLSDARANRSVLFFGASSPELHG